MELLAVNFGSKLDDISEVHGFFGVPDKKGLGHKGRRVVINLGFDESVEGSFACIFGLPSCLVMVRVGVVDLISVFIIDLKLNEIDALLEQVDVSEVFEVENKLSPCAISHLNLN